MIQMCAEDFKKLFKVYRKSQHCCVHDTSLAKLLSGAKKAVEITT